MLLSLAENIKSENRTGDKDGKKHELLYNVDRRINWFSHSGKVSRKFTLYASKQFCFQEYTQRNASIHQWKNILLRLLTKSTIIGINLKWNYLKCIILIWEKNYVKIHKVECHLQKLRICKLIQYFVSYSTYILKYY